MRQRLTMHPEAERLFALDENLRREADEMLHTSGVGSIIGDAGFVPVGSYVMHTMTWRDLDFELYGPMDWDEHWRLGAAIARTGWCYRAHCVDHTREMGFAEAGLYWGLRLAAPDERGPFATGDSNVWKVDLWRAPREEFEERAGAKRRLWQSLLNDETRSHVLAIKEALCHDPRYRKGLHSIDIYEAVLEHGMRAVEEVEEWWRCRSSHNSL